MSNRMEEGWVAVWDWPGEKCHGRWEAWTMHKDREETVARSQCMSMSPDRRKVVRYRLTYGEGSGLPAAPPPGDRIEAAARAMWEVNGNDVSFDCAKDAEETAYLWVMDMARAALSAAPTPPVDDETVSLAETCVKLRRRAEQAEGEAKCAHMKTHKAATELRAAAGQFQHYADLHHAKGTDDGEAKAKTNAEWAERCEMAARQALKGDQT